MFLSLFLKNVYKCIIINNPTIVCSQRRPSYYGDVFIANNKDVDYHMKTVYAKQPKSKVCQLYGM